MGNEVAPEADASGQTSQRTIYDCDDAYRTPSHADFQRLFRSAIIALDANVLIGLYRSNERTRRDTFTVLNQVKERIWIPHQVLSEFWRNRDLPAVRDHHKSKARDACSALDKVSRSTADALKRWLKDVHLTNDGEANRRIKDGTDSIGEALAELKQFIQKQAERDALEGTESTNTDPVLKQLEPILHGRIGDPLPEQDHVVAIEEAARRAEEEIPPGYKDFQSEKPPEKAAGDYLIWLQILNEAQLRERDILLVTGDVKEDWWTAGSGQGAARPRAELRLELKKRAGVDLYMLTPSQLLTEADRVFGLKVDERSVSDLATSEASAPSTPLSRRLVQLVPECLQKAHKRAKQAAEAGATRSLTYGSVVTAVALEELTLLATRLGGDSLRIAAFDYPVMDGCVIVPVMYSRHQATVDHALMYLNSRRPLRDLLDRLIEKKEEISTTDVPGLFTRPNSSLEIVVIPYTADVDSGIHSAHCATLRFSADNSVHWDRIQQIYPRAEDLSMFEQYWAP
ncbi:PIN-like domain-containing protein [Streptomyces tendae]